MNGTSVVRAATTRGRVVAGIPCLRAAVITARHVVFAGLLFFSDRLCDGIRRWRNIVLGGPIQALFHAIAAATSPALIGVHAPAIAVHAGKRHAQILGVGRKGDLHPASLCDVDQRRHDDQ